MVFDIIEKNLQRIEKDLQEFEGLQRIDFIDIFPTSENHKLELEAEMESIATLQEQTERGNVYTFNKPFKTKYGDLEWIKIRYFDESRINWEAASDFVLDNRDALFEKVAKDERFSYIKRDKWDAIEFKTSDTLIYFLKPLASTVYGKKENDYE